MEKTTFLAIYLNDHLAGAAGGVARARALAKAHEGRPDEERLRRLADDVAADRGALLATMQALGVPVRHYKSIAISAGERLGRLKLNGRLRGRSPLTDVVEAEAMRLGVEGKAACWRTLLAITGEYPALDADELRKLLARAEAQITVLEEFRTVAATEAFGGRRGPRRMPSPVNPV